jgi:hypothetical protein
MLTGVIVENSLNDTGILNKVRVLKSWEDGSWKLHKVEVDEATAKEIGKYLADGPWYIHFWAENKDDVLVVFKDAVFAIKYSDQNTWSDAVAYGIAHGVPPKQLTFLIDQQ